MSKQPDKKATHLHIESSDNRSNENVQIKTSKNGNNRQTKNFEINSNKKEEQSNLCDYACIKELTNLEIYCLRFLLIAKIIMVIGLFVSMKKNKECQAELYPKINLITAVYLFVTAFFELINLVLVIISSYGDEIKAIFYLLKIFLSFGLALFLLIFSNLYYNSSETWENCGSIKGWATYTLVVLYIDAIANFIALIFSFFLIFLR